MYNSIVKEYVERMSKADLLDCCADWERVQRNEPVAITSTLRVAARDLAFKAGTASLASAESFWMREVAFECWRRRAEDAETELQEAIALLARRVQALCGA